MNGRGGARGRPVPRAAVDIEQRENKIITPPLRKTDRPVCVCGAKVYKRVEIERERERRKRKT